MTQTRVALLLENIHPGAEEILGAHGFQVRTHTGSLTTGELTEALSDVELLGIRSNTHLDKSVFDAAPRLRAVGCFCIGTNQVDLEAAEHAGVAVFNAPYANSRSVVELVIGEFIALARRLTEKSQAMHDGVWDKSAQGSHEVRGRTLGIVGYGNIGMQLGNLAEALGMSVIYYDIADRPAHGNARRAATLDELLGRADVVSLHVDGRAGNAGLFGAAQFRAMKARALFVNASRGMVVDDHALAEHITSGHLAGAALDVFPVEPKAQGDQFDSSLRGLPNVILTPHVAASTLEAQAEIGRFVSQKLIGYAEEGTTALSVNFPEAQLPVVTGTARTQVAYLNAPGAMAEISTLLATHLDVLAQVCATKGERGYLIAASAAPLNDEGFAELRDSAHVLMARAWGSATPIGDTPLQG